MSFLRKEVEQMRDGNSQGFQKDVQAARSAVYTSLTRSTIGQVQPEVAADAAYRFNRDLDQAIQAKRRRTKTRAALLDPESKEYMLRPSRLQSYMQSARNVMSDEAGKVKAAQKSNAVPAANGNKGTLSAARRLPTYQDYDSLKPGEEYTDPQGHTRRTKGSR
jgi:hypothetical protein